jgi:hypothetical protein
MMKNILFLFLIVGALMAFIDKNISVILISVFYLSCAVSLAKNISKMSDTEKDANVFLVLSGLIIILIILLGTK